MLRIQSISIYEEKMALLQYSLDKTFISLEQVKILYWQLISEFIFLKYYIIITINYQMRNSLNNTTNIIQIKVNIVEPMVKTILEMERI